MTDTSRNGRMRRQSEGILDGGNTLGYWQKTRHRCSPNPEPRGATSVRMQAHSTQWECSHRAILKRTFWIAIPPQRWRPILFASGSPRGHPSRPLPRAPNDACLYPLRRRRKTSDRIERPVPRASRLDGSGMGKRGGNSPSKVGKWIWAPIVRFCATTVP